MTTTRRPEARILVVDDEPNIVELLATSLRFAGFEVRTAADGAAALEVAGAFGPDLLVLDVMMPGSGRLRHETWKAGEPVACRPPSSRCCAPS